MISKDGKEINVKTEFIGLHHRVKSPNTIHNCTDEEKFFLENGLLGQPRDRYQHTWGKYGTFYSTPGPKHIGAA